MKTTKAQLRAAGIAPVCPECGARENEDHKLDCRVNTYLARVGLWAKAQ